ncbi:putative capsule polysaccharide biosynthesis protein [Botrytis cinerea BcDW1]|uniref:Putative capsule polysaccharide biosynthesis protein n=1 Tax=Botryotinia fuckeliana (strain BcDW1) TaxID=1290391 RepID=M7TQ96_BOTF1|nr:putative capsule polysaccharide biosynthesis protein [Botrytis cinerea BcDW1]
MASNSTSWMNNSSWSPSRASTKNPFDDSNGDPFDDVHATPLQDIETGTTVRLSTETQQRDTVVQSSIPSEEKRIIEDIRNERILAGPETEWYNQMKDSCQGFETRVEIGTHFAASTYTLRSLNASIENQTFYLAPIITPQFGSKVPYQYFHRFSGSTANTPNYAIDVDIDHGVWRELHFNGTDELTKWWASGRKKYPSVHPIFDNINTNESATKLNGTFVTRNGHLWLPDFDLIIQGLEDSRNHAEIEPFIRVFDTQGLPHSRTEKLLSPKWNWNNRRDPSILMRTASFGHGKQRLDMCVKENFYYSSSGAQQKLDGVSDGSIMPLAIIAAFRMRMDEMDALDAGKSFGVKKSSEYDGFKAM